LQTLENCNDDVDDVEKMRDIEKEGEGRKKNKSSSRKIPVE
jgi:hypothetical protein